MSLTTLKPRLKAISTSRVKTLDTKAGTTERIRGYAGVKIRQAALLAGHFTCVDCGRVSARNEVDHEIPLEKGGSNDPSNLRVRCTECHAHKTANENKARSGRWT